MYCKSKTVTTSVKISLLERPNSSLILFASMAWIDGSVSNISKDKQALYFFELNGNQPAAKKRKKQL